jgi:hypothetical protein
MESMDPDTERYKARLAALNQLDDTKRLELVAALISRGMQGRRESAVAIVRARFPSVAEHLAFSLVYHAYQELPHSALNLLAWLELNLREAVHERHAGLDFDLRYHLYNWLQAEALAPYGQQDVLDEITEIKECLADNDKDGALAILDSLQERFEAHVSPPDVE